MFARWPVCSYNYSMTGRTHDLAAFVALTGVVIAWDIPELSLGSAVVAVTANLIGGIAPDLDTPTAPFWRNLPIGGIAGRIFGGVVGGHRSLLHSLVGMLLMGWLLNLLLLFLHPSWPGLQADVVWWAFMIGYLSHLVMDSLTKEGVPWLWPLPAKVGFPPIRRWRVTTGKWAEWVIIFPGLLIAEWALIYSQYEAVRQIFHHLTK